MNEELMSDFSPTPGYPTPQGSPQFPQGSVYPPPQGQYPSPQTPNPLPATSKGIIKLIVWISVVIALLAVAAFFAWRALTPGTSPTPTPVSPSSNATASSNTEEKVDDFIGQSVVTNCRIGVLNTSRFPKFEGIRALTIKEIGRYGDVGTQYMMTGIVSGSSESNAIETYRMTCTTVVADEPAKVELGFVFDTTSVEIEPKPVSTPAVSDSSTPTPVVKKTP